MQLHDIYMASVTGLTMKKGTMVEGEIVRSFSPHLR